MSAVEDQNLTQVPPSRRQGFGSGFRLLWWSNLTFFGGAWMLTLVLGWMVYDISGSAVALGLFGACRMAPLLLGPVGGVLADRMHRGRLLVAANWWALAGTVATATVASVAVPAVWLLCVAGAVVGLAQSPSQPARSTLVLDLVGRDKVSSANAMNALAMNVTQVIGPAVGGAVMAALGSTAGLWLAALLFALSLGLFWPLRRIGAVTPGTHAAHGPRLSGGRASIAGVERGTSVAPRSAATPERTVSLSGGRASIAGAESRSAAQYPQGSAATPERTSGLSQVMRNHVVVGALLVTLCANILIWPILNSFMPAFADQQLGWDVKGLGLLLACHGIGGLVGALTVAALGNFRYKGLLFVAGTIAWGLAWGAVALSHTGWLSLVLISVVGLLSAPFGVLQTTLLLLATPNGHQGKVLGLQELAIGAMPLAALAIGAAAARWGLGPTTMVCGLTLAVAVTLLALVFRSLPRFRGIEGS